MSSNYTFECPACGGASIVIDYEGAPEYGYEDSSWCECTECGEMGWVIDFRVEDEVEGCDGQ